MNSRLWREAPIGESHDRDAFDCGDAELDRYIRRYACQNHLSGGAKTFVAEDRAAPSRVLGFYLVSPASLAFARAPAIVSRGLGRYDVPAFRLTPAAAS